MIRGSTLLLLKEALMREDKLFGELGYKNGHGGAVTSDEKKEN